MEDLPATPDLTEVNLTANTLNDQLKETSVPQIDIFLDRYLLVQTIRDLSRAEVIDFERFDDFLNVEQRQFLYTPRGMKVASDWLESRERFLIDMDKIAWILSGTNVNVTEFELKMINAQILSGLKILEALIDVKATLHPQESSVN